MSATPSMSARKAILEISQPLHSVLRNTGRCPTGRSTTGGAASARFKMPARSADGWRSTARPAMKPGVIPCEQCLAATDLTATARTQAAAKKRGHRRAWTQGTATSYRRLQFTRPSEGAVIQETTLLIHDVSLKEIVVVCSYSSHLKSNRAARTGRIVVRQLITFFCAGGFLAPQQRPFHERSCTRVFKSCCSDNGSGRRPGLIRPSNNDSPFVMEDHRHDSVIQNSLDPGLLLLLPSTPSVDTRTSRLPMSVPWNAMPRQS